MNKFLKRTLTFGLLLTMAAGATGCVPNSTPTLTGVEKVIADARSETDTKIEEIRNTPNMEIPDGATVYYVSEYGDDENDGLSEDTPWCTLQKVNETKLEKGSYVCFQRGGIWRGQLVAQEGVTYTAYDEGDKPQFYASPENGADASKWVETECENVWRYTTSFDKDVGCIIFNEGEELGKKMVICGVAGTDNTWTKPAVPEELKSETYYNGTTMEKWEGLSSMDEELQFYHNCLTKKFEGDINDKYVYLYSEENPGEKFDSIEFSINRHVIVINEVNDVTINNLCVKYTGAHGVSAINVENLTTTELEVGYIGGSYQSDYTLNGSAPRYGNGIQVWQYCDGWVCEDNYVYQCYDAGITPQTGISTNPNYPYNEHNMYIKDNVVEYCNYNIEYFISGNATVMQYFKNFIVEDNYLWYAGYGICETRRDKETAAFFKGRGGSDNIVTKNYAENFVIRNNVMIDTTDFMVETRFSGQNMTAEMKESSKPLYENNLMVARTSNFSGLGFYVWKQGDMGERITFDETFDDFLNENYGSGNECWVME